MRKGRSFRLSRQPFDNKQLPAVFSPVAGLLSLRDLRRRRRPNLAMLCTCIGLLTDAQNHASRTCSDTQNAFPVMRQGDTAARPPVLNSHKVEKSKNG
jgi:hypothetical protein